MKHWMRSSLRVLLVVSASAGVSLVLLTVTRSVLDMKMLRAAEEAVGGYLQVLGTIYAVLLAFVVFVVWSQFNECRAYVEKEANEIVDLYRTVGGLPQTIHAPMMKLLRRYVDTVLAKEWHAMARHDAAVLAHAGRVLDDAWEVLRGYNPSCERDEPLYAEVLARFNDLSDQRSNRLTASSNCIPFALRLLIYGGALMTVGSMCLLAVEQFALHALITTVLAGAVSHVIYVIEDLDQCFAGDWCVTPAAFRRARRAMRPVTHRRSRTPISSAPTRAAG